MKKKFLLASKRFVMSCQILARFRMDYIFFLFLFVMDDFWRVIKTSAEYFQAWFSVVFGIGYFCAVILLLFHNHPRRQARPTKTVILQDENDTVCWLRNAILCRLKSVRPQQHQQECFTEKYRTIMSRPFRPVITIVRCTRVHNIFVSLDILSKNDRAVARIYIAYTYTCTSTYPRIHFSWKSNAVMGELKYYEIIRSYPRKRNARPGRFARKNRVSPTLIR